MIQMMLDIFTRSHGSRLFSTHWLAPSCRVKQNKEAIKNETTAQIKKINTDTVLTEICVTIKTNNRAESNNLMLSPAINKIRNCFAARAVARANMRQTNNKVGSQ